MNIKNINTGVCHRRVQAGEPCFFVNWTEHGENKYKFFLQRFVAEDFKKQLIKKAL